MSKILLIGNGPSALEHKMGSRIDSDEFDIVCRINRGHKQDDGSLNTGFEEFTGTRCDYWIVSDLRIELAINRVKDYKGIFVYIPTFKIHPQNIASANYISSKYPSIQFIPPEYEASINNIVDFSPKWPSTGVVAIHFAVNNFKDVYIYGFDTYDIKYDTLHYFEDKPNKYKLKTKGSRVDHNPSHERYYIDYMIKNNKIKQLI